ncbi:probable disease resistance protein At1g58602 isoform X2 [Salvia hispanica]|uniref:probable disease resistance protein At1g58602 isoform X2 n=1 Tax=Salvia hispanica TaxID=49212 RepID=UPI00200986C5|nr:probable disease resistance protein At1g58602 isoform X2 [Salvia hispanica]
MAEAAISWMIQELESLHVTCTKCLERLVIKSKVEELKEMLDFLRDLKLEERNRLRYLIADLVELAYNVMDVHPSPYMSKDLQEKIKATKMRMINFGDEEEAEDVAFTRRSIDMAEAEISSMIRDLESLDVTCTKCLQRLIIKNKIEELKKMLDFLRDLKLKEKSRLKNLIADLVKLAHNVIDVPLPPYMPKDLQDKIKATKMRMINFGDKGEEEDVAVTKRSIDMAEAAISSMIQDLESLDVTCTKCLERLVINSKIEELKKMLDLLRDLKLEEKGGLENLIADLLKLAHSLMDVHLSPYMPKDLQDKIKATKMRMIIFGDEEEEEVVVGLEENVKQLLDKAISKNSVQLQTFCIKGMIGIGKTTLALQLYKASGGQFQLYAWVYLSRDTSKKDILMQLIQQLMVGYEIDPPLEEIDNQNLQRMLWSRLLGMSYFIVLDNVSKEEELQYFLQGFPSQGFVERSMLLFTSRYEFTTAKVDYTYEMKALDSDKSWKLFLKTINKFTIGENKFSKELERKGKEMLKKCGGLPMAIIDVARQKAEQRLSGIEWEDLFDSVDLSESLKSLEPMYRELEDRVKPHFLYLSFFKENAMMREEKLEQIWAANGLDFENNARDLAGGSNLEIVKRHFRKIRCRLNPLLLMISIKKAEEKMGLEIIRSNGNSGPSQNARHRVIVCGREKFNHFSNEDSKHLISLIFHGGGGYLDEARSSYWEGFQLLKILDMEDFGVKTLSETIGTMVELKYLGLRNNYIQVIPHSLAQLENLEVLDIALNFMVEVPDIMWQMSNLHFLHMSNVIFKKPLKVDVLQNLQTLTYISIYDWTYEDSSFESMYDFQTLGVEEVDENSDVGTLFATLAKLPTFENLFIRGFRYKSMSCLEEIGVIQRLKVLKLDGRIGRLPSADNLPRGIEYIALINTCLDEDPMPILEKLRSLCKLKLRNAYTGRKMVIQEGGFPKLDALCINELWNLRGIELGVYGMWSLKKLEINNCPHLETLPKRIRWLSELQKFKMVTTKHIATKIRNSGLTKKIFGEEIHP